MTCTCEEDARTLGDNFSDAITSLSDCQAGALIMQAVWVLHPELSEARAKLIAAELVPQLRAFAVRTAAQLEGLRESGQLPRRRDVVHGVH